MGAAQPSDTEDACVLSETIAVRSGRFRVGGGPGQQRATLTDLQALLRGVGGLAQRPKRPPADEAVEDLEASLQLWSRWLHDSEELQMEVTPSICSEGEECQETGREDANVALTPSPNMERQKQLLELPLLPNDDAPAEAPRRSGRPLMIVPPSQMLQRSAQPCLAASTPAGFAPKGLPPRRRPPVAWRPDRAPKAPLQSAPGQQGPRPSTPRACVTEGTFIALGSTSSASSASNFPVTEGAGASAGPLAASSLGPAPSGIFSKPVLEEPRVAGPIVTDTSQAPKAPKVKLLPNGKPLLPALPLRLVHRDTGFSDFGGPHGTAEVPVSKPLQAVGCGLVVTARGVCGVLPICNGSLDGSDQWEWPTKPPNGERWEWPGASSCATSSNTTLTEDEERWWQPKEKGDIIPSASCSEEDEEILLHGLPSNPMPQQLKAFPTHVDAEEAEEKDHDGDGCSKNQMGPSPS